MTVLALPFAHRAEADQTALVAVIGGTTGDPLVYALLREGDEVVAALSVDAAGAVETRVVPAASAATPTPVPSRAEATRFAAAVRAQVPPDPCGRCEWCDFLCGNFGPSVVCGVATAPVCSPSVAGGPKAVIACGVIFGIFCNLVGYYGCGVMCGATQCGACDPGCENRATDCVTCVDTCPALRPGTSCCRGQCVDRSCSRPMTGQLRRLRQRLPRRGRRASLLPGLLWRSVLRQ